MEPVAADADQLQITALVTAIGASVQVVSIDDSHQGVQLINTPDDKDPVIHLLFRPGHYEVIYHKWWRHTAVGLWRHNVLESDAGEARVDLLADIFV